MKRTIAIVAGGDTSEFHVSLRSAQGIYSFIDKESTHCTLSRCRGPVGKYNCRMVQKHR